MHTAALAKPRSYRSAAPAFVREADNSQWRSAPLFEVPWEGNALVRPVRTVKALHDVSEIFQNNMARRVDWFLDGQEACYLWNGTVKAVITMRPDPIYDWSVREISGVNRAELPPEVETAILVQFARAGFRRRAKSYAL